MEPKIRCSKVEIGASLRDLVVFARTRLAPRFLAKARSEDAKAQGLPLAVVSWFPGHLAATKSSTARVPTCNESEGGSCQGFLDSSMGARNRLGRVGRDVWSSKRSCGRRPVRFAIRASIRGPISSESWNANTTSSWPSRSRTLCEPASRLMLQPIRNSAARTRFAFVAGQGLTPRRT